MQLMPLTNPGAAIQINKSLFLKTDLFCLKNTIVFAVLRMYFVAVFNH